MIFPAIMEDIIILPTAPSLLSAEIAVIIIIAGLINVLAGTIFTISNYSQKNDKFDLDSP